VKASCVQGKVKACITLLKPHACNLKTNKRASRVQGKATSDKQQATAAARAFVWQIK
jgi:hypothetical protein